MLGAIVVGLLVSALAAGAIIVLRVWFAGRTSRVRELPPLVVTVRTGTPGIEPVFGLGATPPLSGSPPAFSSARQRASSTNGERVVFDDARFAGGEATSGRSANSETVRFLRPGEDDPIQILPGRLEVVSGEPKHREIRFVRSPGEPAELILGVRPAARRRPLRCSRTL